MALDSIIENALDAVITIDSGGVITGWNRQAETTFGWLRQETVGLRLSDTIIPPQYRAAHELGMAHYLATGQGPVLNKRIEITGLHRDGHEFPVELAITPLHADGNVSFSAFIRDISQRKQANEALHESEARARAVLETAADGIITIDEAGIVESFNPAAARIFGYVAEEVIGQNVSMLMPEPYRSQHDGYMARYLTTGQAKIIGIGREIEGQRKGGAIFPLYLAISEVQLTNRRIFTGIVRDITEVKQAQESLRKLNEELEQRVAERTMQLAQTNADLKQEIVERKQLETVEREQRKLAEALSETALTINSTLDFDIVLDRLLEQIARIVQYDVAQVLLVEDDLARLVRLRGLGRFETDVTKIETDFVLHIAESGNLQQMLETGLPLIISDTAAYESWQHVNSFSACRSWAGAPIVVQGEVVAFFALYKMEPNYYHPQDIERLRAFAGQGGVALENIRLYQAIQHQVQELKTLNTISQAATSTLQLDEMLEIITDHIFKLLNIQAASLVLKEEASNQLLFATAVGWGAEVIKGQRINANQGIVGWCIEHSEPVLVPDVSRDPRYFGEFDHVKKQPNRSVLCVPLQTRGRTIGAIEVVNKKEGQFNEQDLQLLSSMAAPVAAAIENSQLYRRVRRHAAELEERVAERTAELSATNAELARAARMKDEFLASMSHELRTPLNAILGMSEALQEETFGSMNQDQLDALQDIAESGRHLLSLINDILDLSKVAAGKLELQVEPVSVETVSQASLRLVKQTAHQKRLKVLFTQDETVTWLLADERYLKQILVNLLSNAVKFTPEGGRVGLEIMGDARLNTIQFTVWDTGIGIAAENMENLFKPFVQLDSRLGRRYGGTGLGLALVYRMTELQGGSISVSSEPGQGSRFTVTLPWEEAHRHPIDAGDEPLMSLAAVTPETGPPPATDSLPNLREHAPLILLAEDNESNIKMFSRYLCRLGCRVEVALNGIQAITQARILQPDVILMDIQMPEMDGLEAIGQVRADPHLAGIPIIAVTALAMPGDRDRCLAAGANEYLSKPVNLKLLAEAIEAQLIKSDHLKKEPNS